MGPAGPLTGNRLTIPGSHQPAITLESTLGHHEHFPELGAGPGEVGTPAGLTPPLGAWAWVVPKRKPASAFPQKTPAPVTGQSQESPAHCGPTRGRAPLSSASRNPADRAARSAETRAPSSPGRPGPGASAGNARAPGREPRARACVAPTGGRHAARGRLSPGLRGWDSSRWLPRLGDGLIAKPRLLCPPPAA